jgi:hypothetical protein
MIIPLKDLDLPIKAIERQAKGNKTMELILAASYGYRLACNDKAKFLKDT